LCVQAVSADERAVAWFELDDGGRVDADGWALEESACGWGVGGVDEELGPGEEVLHAVVGHGACASASADGDTFEFERGVDAVKLAAGAGEDGVTGPGECGLGGAGSDEGGGDGLGDLGVVLGVDDADGAGGVVGWA